MNDKSNEEKVLKVAHVVESMEDDLESAVNLVITELSSILAKNFVGQVLDHKKYKQFLDSIKQEEEVVEDDKVCEVATVEEAMEKATDPGDNVVPFSKRP